MSLRSDLAACLARDRTSFTASFPDVVASHDIDARMTAFHDGIEAVEGPTDRPTDALDPWTRELVWRLWLLDDAPVGLTLSGPAYQDNPIRYVNNTFRELTGYGLGDVLGTNPRFLQGPDTEAGPVADLREATSIWEPVTVELRNYRADGTAFRNRVSLVPIEGPDGSVGNWVGIQRAIETD
jgi:PAS domain S-box-containing protein